MNQDVLRNWADRGTRAWPDVSLPLDGFVAYLVSKVSAESPATTAPRLLHGPDLYLVYACLQGHPRAPVHFEARCFPEVDRVLRRMRISSGALDDIKGRLREKLFFPHEGELSPLVSYSGRGELKKWIRSVAMRDALAALRADGKISSADDEETCMLAANDNPELVYLKTVFASAFQSAARQAMDALSLRERNLLRQHVLDGLTIDKLGLLYGVHRATAARWVVSVRRRLLDEVRQRLMSTLQLSESGFESAVRMARSQLDISVERLFGTTGRD